MTEPLRVGQFGILGHEPVDRAPNAGVFRGKGPIEDRAELYLIAEGTTPAGEVYAEQVVAAAGLAFGTFDMSLSGSMRKLFEEAERTVSHWNQTSISQHRVRLGMTAFGLRQGQAVLAQVGPGVAYHLHKGKVTTYYADGDHSRPIGSGSGDPQLIRVPFEPGDRMLLMSSTSQMAVDEELAAGILQLPEDQILADLYHRVQSVADLTVMLVAAPDPKPGAGLTSIGEDGVGGAALPAAVTRTRKRVVEAPVSEETNEVPTVPEEARVRRKRPAPAAAAAAVEPEEAAPVAPIVPEPAVAEVTEVIEAAAAVPETARVRRKRPAPVEPVEVVVPEPKVVAPVLELPERPPIVVELPQVETAEAPAPLEKTTAADQLVLLATERLEQATAAVAEAKSAAEDLEAAKAAEGWSPLPEGTAEVAKDLLAPPTPVAATSAKPRRLPVKPRSAPKAPPMPEESAQASSTDMVAEREGRRKRKTSFTRGLVREERPAPPDTLAAEPAPLLEELAAESRERTASLANNTPVPETIAEEAGAGAGASTTPLITTRGHISGRWRATGTMTPTKSAGGSAPPTWMVIGIGLAVLLLLVGVLTVPGMLKDDPAARYQALVNEAQQKYFVATTGQPNLTQKRQALTDARALLLQARDLQQGNGTDEADKLLEQVSGDLQQMDNVKAPARVDVIADLTQFGTVAPSVTRLAVGGDQAYLLDSAGSQVVMVTMANGEKKVIYNEDPTQKRGRPVAITFMDTGENGGAKLIIADDSKGLWSFTPAAGLKQLGFAAPASLKIYDIAASGPDLYVLDASGDPVIYRFPATTDGFSAPPAKLVTDRSLAGARRLTVDRDILTVDANGAIHLFSGQLSMELAAAGIDKPLQREESPQTLTQNGEIAILDAANNRVVVLSREGTFLRQYQSSDFKAASAFTVKDGLGYIFSDGRVRRITW